MVSRVQQVMRALRYAFADIAYPRQALIVGEGETLVLNFDTLTHAEADQIKARIRADAPWLPVLLVCADDISTRRRVSSD